MSMNIRYPNITGLSEKEQLAQIKSFLHQLVDQLNYAFPTLTEGSSTQTVEVQGGEMSYYELRSLIIHELQEVDRLFESLSGKMESDYVSNEKLPQAINTALAQAKESGEFDGPQGPQGEKGDAGPQGPKGDKGEKGDQGVQGPKGDDGTGVTILGSFATEEELNTAHPTGSSGDSYLVNGDLYVWSDTVSGWQNVGNIKGPKGDKGDQGEQGIQGIPGEKGEQGEQGPQGDKGDTGSKGDKGDTGPKGDKGDTGPQGEQGIQGPQGEQGPKGEQGIQGPKGDQGIQGPKGDKGEPGNNGADGTDGSDGFSPTVEVTSIDGGHRVTITDAYSQKTFNVMNGTSGGSGLSFELDDGTIIN